MDIDQALRWLAQLPAHLDVWIERTNRTGEDTHPARRNIHGLKSFRFGDWQCRIQDPTPFVDDSGYAEDSENVGFGDGNTPLEAIQQAKKDYRRHKKESGSS